jgi:hypothetical protein
MNYDTDYIPTTEEATDSIIYIATWTDDTHSGEACSYDEQEYDAYEARVLRSLDGDWHTETDDTGVYLVQD